MKRKVKFAQFLSTLRTHRDLFGMKNKEMIFVDNKTGYEYDRWELYENGYDSVQEIIGKGRISIKFLELVEEN